MAKGIGMKQFIDYTKINAENWNKWAEDRCTWTIPISHDEYISALNSGTINVFLTPTKPVPQNWFCDLTNANVLGLASGGGQQCPIFTARGANVTVFDISRKQLDSERLVADREGYKITLVEGNMATTFPFEDESFDLIFNPISNCYVRDVLHIWKECYRVLKKGGVLLSGFVNPILYMFGIDNGQITICRKIPYDSLKDCSGQRLNILSNTDGFQFSHTLETLLNGQLNAGFQITNLYEDYHPVETSQMNFKPQTGDIASYLSDFTPIYIATRACK